MTEKGKLYLIPTTLGDNEPLEVLPLSVESSWGIRSFYCRKSKNCKTVYQKIDP